MSDSIIAKIQELFIREANSSPLLLSDLANMEKYISESYQGRSLIELLQNADDALATKFIIEKISRNVYVVANNGRKFNDDDVLSICRSGASTKQRKGNSIGFRGIGFKSIVNYANCVHLISGEIELTFSKDLTKRLLTGIDNVPLIRIPHILNSNEYSSYIEQLRFKGYTTIFIFVVSSDELSSEMNDFIPTSMLFLQNINEIDFCIDSTNKSHIIKREHENGDKVFATICSQSQSTNWLILNNTDKCSIAFELNEDKRAIVMDKEDCVIHSFMPTKDYTGLPIKLNGDFSTDPSRTKIVMDNETLAATKGCANILVGLIVDTIVNENDANGIIEVLINIEQDSIFAFKSKKPSDILVEQLKIMLCNVLRTTLLKGQEKEIYLQPLWLEDNDFKKSCYRNSVRGLGNDLEKKVPNILLFLSKMGFTALPLEVAISDSNHVEFSIVSKSKIFAEIIKKYRFGLNEVDKELISQANLIEFETGCKPLAKCKENDKLLPKYYAMMLDLVNDEKDLLWILRKFNLYNDATGSFNISNKAIMKNNAINIHSARSDSENELINLNFSQELLDHDAAPNNYFKEKPTYQKWRSVEENVATAIESMKNVVKVTDVSKSNLGYDLEVQGIDRTTYIEVKSVNNLGDSFSMTNNEYATAVEYKDKYALAIVEQNTDSLKICLIYNPIDKLALFKRVTRWEWVCNEYSGNVINTLFN